MRPGREPERKKFVDVIADVLRETLDIDPEDVSAFLDKQKRVATLLADNLYLTGFLLTDSNKIQTHPLSDPIKPKYLNTFWENNQNRQPISKKNYLNGLGISFVII